MAGAIIVVEGLDKTGKSTTVGELATKLLEYGPVKCLHFGKPLPGEDVFRIYLETIRAADQFDGSTIIDRFSWSEEAYGRTYRKNHTLSGDAIDALDTVLRQAGGVVILKYRQPAEIFQQLDANDHSTKGYGAKVLLEDLIAIDTIFDRRLTEQRVRAHRVPFTLAVPPAVIDRAIALRQESINRKEKQ
jgi:hypothetical protein